jgi:hypothetical protein
MLRLCCYLLVVFIVLIFLWLESRNVILFDDDYSYPYPLKRDKEHLRSIIPKEDSDNAILELEKGAYEGTYVKVIELAEQSITSYNFTMFCKPVAVTTCDKYDGYKEFLQDPSKAGLVSIITKHKINPEEFTERFLAKLRIGFPDSIITYAGTKQCCPYYSISWK